MNKQLNNFIKATQELENYLGIEDLTYYGVSYSDSFFTLHSNRDIGWAKSLEDLENQDGKYYDSEFSAIRHTEELTAVLIDSDFDDGKYWIIFNNKNKV